MPRCVIRGDMQLLLTFYKVYVQKSQEYIHIIYYTTIIQYCSENVFLVYRNVRMQIYNKMYAEHGKKVVLCERQAGETLGNCFGRCGFYNIVVFISNV